MMNWGIRVTLLSLGFVLFMTFLVVKAFKQDFDLVTEDYYGKELKFQEQIDKQNNHNQWKEGIRLTTSGDMIVIGFPSELKNKTVVGEILFFRPSDEKKDKRIKVFLQKGEQQIPRSLLEKGYYRVQVDYQAEGKEFYFEDSIIL